MKVVNSTRHIPIRLGSSESDVRESLGTPLHHSTSDTWFYRRVYIQEPTFLQDSVCDSLVITFNKRVVSDLKLMNCTAASLVQKQLKGGPRVAYVRESPNLRVAGAMTREARE